MRSNHIVAALAIAACLASSPAFAGAPLSCGNGPCETGEDCFNCPSDCGCDDGLFCNGLESCNPGTQTCEAVSPCPPFTDGCVIRNDSCDEDNDECIDFADDSLCAAGEACTPEGACVRVVPTATGWGVASLGLLLLAGLTIKFRGALPKRA